MGRVRAGREQTQAETPPESQGLQSQARGTELQED